MFTLSSYFRETMGQSTVYEIWNNRRLINLRVIQNNQRHCQRRKICCIQRVGRSEFESPDLPIKCVSEISLGRKRFPPARLTFSRGSINK